MCVINLLVSSVSYLNKIFRWPVLTYTGKISYGLYIFHPICIAAVENSFREQPFVLVLLLIIASSYFIASVSYYGYEFWFLKQKDRFENFKWSKPTRNITVKSI